MDSVVFEIERMCNSSLIIQYRHARFKTYADRVCAASGLLLWAYADGTCRTEGRTDGQTPDRQIMLCLLYTSDAADE